MVDQNPKPSETHSNTFPQDSNSYSESEIELRSTHTSSETTTSDELDGTLVDTSSSTTPTPSLSGEGELDSAEGHSQPIGGTLPLTEQSPPDIPSTGVNPQEENPPPGPSVAKGPTSTDTPTKDTPDCPPDLGDTIDKKLQNLAKASEERVTTPPSKELEQTVATPPSDNTYTKGVLEDPSVPKEPTFHKEESPTDYPFKDHPEAPLGAEDGLVILPVNRTQCVPPDNHFSRFWSGQTADTSDTNKRRPRWLIRKPQSHSVDLEELDKQGP